MGHLIMEAGTTAQQRPFAGRKLKAALHGATVDEAAVLHAILRWRGSYTTTNGHGTVSPGVAAWQTLKNQLQALALRPLGPAGRVIGGGEPNGEHVFDVNIGQAYALRTLGPRAWRRAASITFRILSKRYHSADPTGWREPRAMFPQSTLGAEQPPPMPFFDRGTFEQVEELGP
jgi:hypothetical protein